MRPLTSPNGAYKLLRPDRFFPVTRHLSYLLTHLIYRLPFTPNHVTALSLATGLIGAWYFSIGSWGAHIIGALWLIGCYTLDNCDGEIARLKSMSSKWGAIFDDFTDWLVDSSFFVSLGFGTWQKTGELIWFWLGLAASIGSTIDYIIDVVLYSQAKNKTKSNIRVQEANNIRKPEDTIDWVIYIFHKLTRADFCLIVFGLALFDILSILLPLGAVGAQIYWITDLFKRARGWHT